MSRPLPSLDDARRILADKRTRPPRRAPPTAARPLAPFIKALDERFGKGADGLKARWREIAGEVMAARTEPMKLSNPRGGGPGVLELKVDGPGAALIQHQAPEILARVNLFLGEGSVAKLRIVQGVVRRPGVVQSAAAARRRRLPPLDAALEAGLEASLSEVADEPLKAALRRLGREVLRREA